MKYHIKNWLTEKLDSLDRFAGLSDAEEVILYDEIKNATLQEIVDKIKDRFESKYKCSNSDNSLLLWVFELTDIYPTGKITIKDQGAMMDIDSDIENSGRARLIEYIKQKYGEDKVCQVSTFGTLQAKAALRNSVRALCFPIELGNKLAKFIPDTPGISITDSYNNNDEFRDFISTDANAKEALNIALKLEGITNNLSIHASAILITEDPIWQSIPQMKSMKKDGDVILSQFDYYDCESREAVKFDILGLRCLDIISMTIKLIKKYNNISIDINSIDLTDKNVYQLMTDGHVEKVFQFSSSLFKDYTARAKPQSIEDLSAITSLLRPAAMGSGLHEHYLTCKNEGVLYDYDLKDKNLIKKVQEICARSYSVMCYQEETIACFSQIAGWNPIEAEAGRRSLAKKKLEAIKAMRQKFLDGGMNNGYEEESLNILFNKIEQYAEYGFSICHAAPYSILSFQTAYLSCYYPLAYFCAALTVDCNDEQDVIAYIRALKQRGFQVLSPDINNSEDGFVIHESSIMFGFSAIKGVGATVSKKVVKNKPKKGYTSFGQFVFKNKDILNKTLLEQYIKAGCFLSLGYNKETLLLSVASILEFMSNIKEITTYTIFDFKEVKLEDSIERLIKFVPIEDKTDYEIQSLGLYLNKHPLEDYTLKDRATIKTAPEFLNFDDRTKVCVVGAISGVQIRKTKSKVNMANFNITSPEGSIKAIIFPKDYPKLMNWLEEGKVLMFGGMVKFDNDENMLMVSGISDKWESYFTKSKKQIDFCSPYDIVDGSMDKIYVEVNSNLKYVLEK